MAEKRIITKIVLDTGQVVEGVAQVKAHLKSMGETASQAARRQQAEVNRTEREYRRLAASLDPNIRAHQELARAQNTLNKALAAGLVDQREHARLMAHAEAQARRSAGGTLGFAGALRTLAGSYAAVRGAQLVRDSLREWDAERKAVAQLEATIRSTGGAARLTARELIAMADAGERRSDFGAEEIQAAQQRLLTYTNVQGETFKRAQRAAIDMAAALGQDVASAAETVGRALGSPLHAMEALSRQGFRFTTEQKQQIKTFVESGEVAKAQAIILGELELAYAGSAEAARSAFADLPRIAGDAKKAFGEGLAPAIQDVTRELSNVADQERSLDFLREMGEGVGALIPLLAAVAELWWKVASGPSSFIRGAARQAIGIGDDDVEAANRAAFSAAAQRLADQRAKEAAEQARRDAEQAKADAAAEAAAKRRAEQEEKAKKALERYREALPILQETTREQLAIAAAYGRGEEAGAAMARQLEIERRFRAAAKDLAREHHAELRRVIAAQVDAERRVAGAEAIASLRQQIGEQARLTAALSRGAGAAESTARAIAVEADVRQAAAKAAADQRQEIERLIHQREAERQGAELVEAATEIEAEVAAMDALVVAFDQGSAAMARAGAEQDRQAKRHQMLSRLTKEQREQLEGLVDTWLDYEQALRGLQHVNALRGDAEFARRAAGVDQADPRLRDLEVRYLDWLRRLGDGSVERGEEVFAGLSAAFGVTVDDIKRWLGELDDAGRAERYRGAGTTGREAHRQKLAEIDRLVGAGLVSVRDGQAATNEETQRFWSEQLGHWSSALGLLADEFGGFFSYTQKAVNALQQAQGLGNSTSNLISGGAQGMAIGGAAGAAGAMAGTLYLFYVAYKEVSAHIKRGKLKNYSSEGEYSLVGGREGQLVGVSHQATEATKAIRQAVREFEDALRISVTDLETIGIKVRNDGKYVKAYLAGEFLGKFKDVDEAIAEALRQAVMQGKAKLAGLSDLMREGLASWTMPDADLLMEFLGDLRRIGDLGLSQGAIGLQETTRQLDRFWQTLERLGAATPALVGALGNLVVAELNAWQAWHDSFTGREKTREELLAEKKRDAELFEAEKALRIAELQLRKADAEAHLAYLQAKRGLLQADASLRQQELDLHQAQLEALARLIGALTGIPTIDTGKIRLPDAGGGGASLDSRQGVRDWLAEREWQSSLAGKTDYERARAELDREYERQREAAKGDAELLRRLNEQREREGRLLEKQEKRETTRDFQEAIGTWTRFDDVRESFADLRERIEGAGYGAERTARMLARLAAAEGERIRAMSLEGMTDLLGQANVYLEDQELAQELERMRFELVVANYQAEFELLKLKGDLTDAEIARLGEVLARLEGFDFDGWWQRRQTGGGGGGRDYRAANDNAPDPAKLIEDARALLQTYKDARLDETERQLRKIHEDFATIFKTLGRGPETLAEFDAALERTFKELTGGIRSLLDELRLSDYAPLDPRQRLAEAERIFEDLAGRAQGGDYEAYRQVDAAARAYIEELRAAYATSPAFHSEYAEILAALERLASMRPFATGGITHSPAIFGEAGPEAAVPLPDGRTIPVTLHGAAFAPVVEETRRAGVEVASQVAQLTRRVEQLATEMEAANLDNERLRNQLSRLVALLESQQRRAA